VSTEVEIDLDIKLLIDREMASYPRRDPVKLELQNRAKMNAYRKTLLEGAISESEVTSRLRKPSAEILEMITSKQLLAVEEQPGWLFPVWQFDSTAQDGIVPGLSKVLRALDATPLSQISWFQNPHPDLRNQKPCDVLRKGKIKVLEVMACRVGVK
jgi:hypothetical protein